MTFCILATGSPRLSVPATAGGSRPAPGVPWGLGMELVSTLAILTHLLGLVGHVGVVLLMLF